MNEYAKKSKLNRQQNVIDPTGLYKLVVGSVQIIDLQSIENRSEFE